MIHPTSHDDGGGRSSAAHHRRLKKRIPTLPPEENDVGDRLRRDDEDGRRSSRRPPLFSATRLRRLLAASSSSRSSFLLPILLFLSIIAIRNRGLRSSPFLLPPSRGGDDGSTTTTAGGAAAATTKTTTKTEVRDPCDGSFLYPDLLDDGGDEANDDGGGRCRGLALSDDSILTSRRCAAVTKSVRRGVGVARRATAEVASIVDLFPASTEGEEEAGEDDNGLAILRLDVGPYHRNAGRPRRMVFLPGGDDGSAPLMGSKRRDRRIEQPDRRPPPPVDGVDREGSQGDGEDDDARGGGGVRFDLRCDIATGFAPILYAVGVAVSSSTSSTPPEPSVARDDAGGGRRRGNPRRRSRRRRRRVVPIAGTVRDRIESVLGGETTEGQNLRGPPPLVDGDREPRPFDWTKRYARLTDGREFWYAKRRPGRTILDEMSRSMVERYAPPMPPQSQEQQLRTAGAANAAQQEESESEEDPDDALLSIAWTEATLLECEDPHPLGGRSWLCLGNYYRHWRSQRVMNDGVSFFDWLDYDEEGRCYEDFHCSREELESTHMKWFDEDELAEHEVRIDLVDVDVSAGGSSNGTVVVPRLVHPRTGVPPTETGPLLFVWTTDERLYVAKEVKGTVKHTSFNGGLPVKMAGVVEIINDGVVVLWKRSSGHYRPKAFHVQRFQPWLEGLGVTSGAVPWDEKPP